jgi:hypothetical protein
LIILSPWKNGILESWNVGIRAKSTYKIRKTSDFRKLFGIWKGKEITSSALR